VVAEAELLSLSERTLRGLSDDTPTVAATLAANLSRIRAQRQTSR